MRRDAGQVVMMLAVIMPFIVLMLAFLVNISLLIHQKIRLQNATDAGAYSAAASLARDLNHIAELNANIDSIWHGSQASLSDPNLFITRWSESLTDIAADTSFNGQEMAQAQVTKYQNDYASILSEIENVSSGAFGRATALGRRAALITYYNGDDAQAEANPASLSFSPAFDAASSAMLQYAEGSTQVELGYVNNAGACNAVTDACSGYDSLVATINVPIRKTNAVSFVGAAGADPGFNPLAANRFVAEPWRLNCLAAAQPYGGSIEGLSNTYGAALIPIGNRANDGGTYYH
jgi:hypothetical protein